MSLPVKLSIIIVNYNGKHFLKDCIASIEKYLSCSYEIILVDNDSHDGSIEYIKKNLPQVTFIESKVNTGFTGGNNLGASHATGELLLLLNNDTKIESDITEILQAFDSEKDLGIAGCNMHYADGRLQYSMGFEHTPLRILMSWIGLKKYSFMPDLFRREIIDSSCYAKRRDHVAWVSGAFLMVRRHLWEQVDGLNDDYFMYMEDVDFCKSIALLGYNVAYFPTTKITHYEGAGKVWIGEGALSRTLRSYLIYTKKYYGVGAMFLLRLALFPIMIARSLCYVSGYFTGNALKKDKCKSFLKVAFTVLKH